ARYQSTTHRAQPRIILLANHGLIIAADTPDEIRTRTDQLLSKISARLGPDWKSNPFGPPIPEPNAQPLINAMATILRGLLAEFNTPQVVTFDDSPLVASFVSADAAKTLPAQGPLNPDQIVY